MFGTFLKHSSQYLPTRDARSSRSAAASIQMRPRIASSLRSGLLGFGAYASIHPITRAARERSSANSERAALRNAWLGLDLPRAPTASSSARRDVPAGSPASVPISASTLSRHGL